MSEGSGRASPVEAMAVRWGVNYPWYVTITAMMGTISTILSSTIVNVALPDIMGTFGMGQDKAQLISTGFLAAMTGTMLLNAWLVDSFGQRVTFSGTLALFVAASTMGGLAQDGGTLIVARVLQGAAAGVLQPLAMQVIFQVFPPERRGSAMGIYGVGVVLAPALGPAIGGVMIDGLNWRYVFFMAIPFCLIGIAFATLFMPGRIQVGARKAFDWIGFGLVATFLVALLTGLANGQRDGWLSHTIILAFTIAMLGGSGFIWWQTRMASPLLNLSLFSIPSFAGASVVAFVFGAGIFGSTYLVPLFVQTVQGYTATRAGLLLMPAGLLLTIVLPVAGRLSDRLPAYLLIVSGLLLFALSSWLTSGADTNTTFWSMAVWIMIGRVGLALIMPSLNAAALRPLPVAILGQGSGAVNFIRQLGGALGTNFLAIGLERRTELYAQTFAASQDMANPATAEFLRLTTGMLEQGGVSDVPRLGAAYDFLGRVLQAQASILGFRDGFLLVALAFLAAVLPAFLMRRRSHTSRDG